MTQIVPCGFCGKALRRDPEVLRRGGLAASHRSSATEVFTRTLVGGEFLPSCSAGCANELRRAAGLPLIAERVRA